MQQPAPLVTGDPQRLGPFTLVGRLGEGGQGVVYLGVDAAGERAAVKLLHVKFTGDRQARSRFARELKAAQRVAPFCTARVLHADLEGDTPYIASEYIEGRSLRETVETDGPLHGSALQRLAVGTATALAAIHRAGIVHRDFKPDNVLMAADGPRVVDFGIARILDSTGTVTSRAVGTPAYMAPEQVSGDRTGPYTDVFSWAVTVLFAATGRQVFGAPSFAAVLHRILTHHPDLSVLPRPLRDVADACLRKRPEDRPTADEVLLRLLSRPEPDGPPPAPSGEAEPETVRLRVPRPTVLPAPVPAPSYPPAEALEHPGPAAHPPPHRWGTGPTDPAGPRRRRVPLGAVLALAAALLLIAAVWWYLAG